MHNVNQLPLTASTYTMRAILGQLKTQLFLNIIKIHPKYLHFMPLNHLLKNMQRRHQMFSLQQQTALVSLWLG